MTRARDNADLGDSFGVLGSGVTGGSGLTALGTVATGNLSNPAIVFPGEQNSSGGGGHVLQVVSFSSSTQQSTSSTSYVDSYLTKNITPSSTSSKILVLVSASVSLYKESSPNDLRAHFQLVRGSTALETKQLMIYASHSGGRLDNKLPISFVFLDSPASDSALTYKIQWRADSAGAQTPYVAMQNDSHYSDIILMEVAG